MDKHAPNWKTGILALSTILCILLLAGVYRSIEFKMLHHFQDSETDSTPIRISKERLPDWFWTSTQKTISVELVVTLKECKSSQSTTLFLLGESETPVHFQFSCAFGFYTVNMVELNESFAIFGVLNTEDGRRHALLNFQFEIDTSEMTLSFIRKTGAVFLSLKNVEIARVNSPEDKFSTLNLPHDSNIISHAKNV